MNNLSEQFNDWWEVAIEKKPAKNLSKIDEEIRLFQKEYETKTLIQKLEIIYQFIDESVVYSGQNNEQIIKDQAKFNIAIALFGNLIFENFVEDKK